MLISALSTHAPCYLQRTERNTELHNEPFPAQSTTHSMFDSPILLIFSLAFLHSSTFAFLSFAIFVWLGDMGSTPFPFVSSLFDHWYAWAIRRRKSGYFYSSIWFLYHPIFVLKSLILILPFFLEISMSQNYSELRPISYGSSTGETVGCCSSFICVGSNISIFLKNFKQFQNYSKFLERGITRSTCRYFYATLCY